MRAAAAFVLGYAGLITASYATCMPGRYAGTGGAEGQAPFPVLVTIACDGERVSGQIESVFGTAQIVSGETTQDQWRLEALFDSQPLTLHATRQGEEWRGAYALGPNTGELTLRHDDAATFAAMTAEAPERTDLTTDEWRADLAALAQQIPARHANAFHAIDRAAWDAAVTALNARMPGLTAVTAPVALRELAARVGDGHTQVRLPATQRLPIGMYWFGDELRVVQSSADHTDLLGARILRIGDRPTRQALRDAERLLARENRWSDIGATPYLLRRKDVLTYLGMAEPDGTLRLRVRLAGGGAREVRLQFGGAEMTAFVGGAPPIWRQQPDEGLWWRELPGGIFYVNFRNYDQLRTRSAQLFAEIDRVRPARVAFDMRDNGGGDFTVFRESLLAAIRERPWLNQHDKLYVLVGREMFSAAMTNAADLHLQTNATLVGEPIGERPNSYQEVRFFPLPNSHLRVGVSTEYYEALPGAGDPEAVTPDVAAPPTFARFSRGEDDALEWIRHH